MAKVATTGKNQRWGTFLYLLARSFGSRTAFELGSCAGISAYYLSSVPSIETLITVEGSANLARISEQTLAEVSRKSRVVNKTFDEAIDSELPALGRPVDFVYVDGHHEKIATIHYFDRVVPFLEKGALVVFDDISWSQDMREAWEILRARREFSHTIDLGVIGVCLVKEGKDGQRPPATWDVRPIIGDRSIGDPKGWKE
jgi:predicted O-methyltransferase YrrM